MANTHDLWVSQSLHYPTFARAPSDSTFLPSFLDGRTRGVLAPSYTPRTPRQARALDHFVPPKFATPLALSCQCEIEKHFQ